MPPLPSVPGDRPRRALEWKTPREVLTASVAFMA